MTDEEIEEYEVGVFSKLDHIRNSDSSELTGEKFLRKGADIGNEFSQNCGIFYPTPIDIYAKAVLGIKCYGRYCDDCYAIDSNREVLEHFLHVATEIAESLGIHTYTQQRLGFRN